MSTPNYVTQKEFRTFVCKPTVDEEYAKEWEEENGIPFDYDNELEFMYRDVCDQTQADIDSLEEEFNRKLKFFTIEVESGRYCGLQIVANAVPYVENYGTPEELDNEMCQYCYGMCRSKAMRAYESEVKFINKKVLPYLAERNGFVEIRRMCIFSNGEAVYERVEKVA